MQTEFLQKTEEFDFFKLLPDSPAIGKGKLITGNGGFDFWGTPLPTGSNQLNLGVWQQNW
jgi:hypothetical protein